MHTELLLPICASLLLLLGCPSGDDDDTTAGDDDVVDDDDSSADDDTGDDDSGDDDTAEPPDPMALAELLVVCDGEDPDVAVDDDGHLHVVYERGGETWYREVVYPDRAGACVAWGDSQVIVRCVGL